MLLPGIQRIFRLAIEWVNCPVELGDATIHSHHRVARSKRLANDSFAGHGVTRNIDL